jgi:hypothetical protein
MSIEKALAVPDALNLKHFLSQARTVWIAAHPEQAGRRGRPSERKRVFDACDRIWQERDGKRRLTQGWLIRSVQEMLDSQRLHQDTIKRHVKEWIECTLTLSEIPQSYLKKPEVQEAVILLDTLFDAVKKHWPAIQSLVSRLPPDTKLKDVGKALEAQQKVLPSSARRRTSH